MENINLNPQQKAAVEAPMEPLLIVAGAGTGKTRTLTCRLIHFIKSGLPPQKICAITFTNKAAKEMASRISDLGYRTSDIQYPFIGTFHALGARILRKECRLLGRKPNFAIFDDHDSFGLVKKITKKLLPAKGAKEKNEKPLDDARGRREEYEKPAYFAQKISEIKNTCPLTPERSDGRRAAGIPKNLGQDGDPKNKLVSKVFGLYEKKLEENNAFDFDDLIEKVVYLLKTRPEILQKYQKKFDAILVDEYQDLNPEQYELVKLLAGDHRNISVVGDDEQMIYGWRYANLKTFLDFERDWPGAQVIFLEENYRSSAKIIGAASAVAANNVYRRPKNLWTRNPDGDQIKIFEAGDEIAEAEWIAKEIQNVKILPSARLAVGGKNQNKGTTAILYRTNAQSRAVEQALLNNRIPYEIYGGVKFYERKEIKDILAALRFAANRNDEISRERLEKNLAKRKFSDLTEKIAGARKRSASPVELINTFLKTTDYMEYLEKNYLNYDERRENVGELVHFASRYDDLPQFLEEIALVQSADMPSAGDKLHDEDKPASDFQLPVTSLMTIHLAKGLEFDDVFVAGATEGLLPHARSLDDEYQMEEERRLMYVAMTRAKKNLHISFFDEPSRFLSEIPEEFIELEDKSGGDLLPDDKTENFISYD